MPSNFGWVDLTENDRQEMLDIISLFKEQETRDELGVGTVRDAFSNYFFPGTSTIQTRARYMLFVPWIYTSLEQKSVGSDKITNRARNDEIKLIYALLKSEDLDGVIGRDARDKLQRLPSSVYWTGLSSWGIKLFEGSQDQYHRFLDAFYRRQRYMRQADDDDVFAPVMANWDPGLPAPPDAFLDHTSLELTWEEATYLKDKIQINHHGSLLAQLVDQDELLDGDLLWQLPLIGHLPQQLRTLITHTQNFSESIHGAFILYNLLLARLAYREELINAYQEYLDKWQKKIISRLDMLAPWAQQREQFWSCAALHQVQIPHPARTFIDQWLDALYADPSRSISDDPKLETLIKYREYSLKKKRARLQGGHALEIWSGASGLAQLDFRWRVAKNISNDIIRGLSRLSKE